MAGVDIASALTGWRVRFLFFLLAVLEFYLVGVGAVDDPQETQSYFVFAVLLHDQKYRKSSKRAFPSL